MGNLFGTDGVRGVANIELTPELAFQLGFKGAYVLNKKNQGGNKILVGRDTRISGTMLESAIAAGICAAGLETVLLGVIPTPGVAYLTKKEDAVAGIVISASHNPAEDNGIKFFGSNGYKLPDAVEDEIEELILKQGEINRVTGRNVGIVSRMPNAAEIYAEYLVEQIGSDLSGLKIVVDGANGAASLIAPGIFKKLGADVISINCAPNGLNINADCGSTHTESLSRAVVYHKADIGLAFDGDADRLMAVDEKGVLLDGDKTMVICANHLKKNGELFENKLVVTIMSNMGLKIAMEKAGIQVLNTKVGDRYVLEKMLETGAVLGGEQSGHIIFSNINTTGDGLVTALYLLTVLQKEGVVLSDLAAQMQHLPQVMKNVRVKTKVDWDSNAQIMEAIHAGADKLGEEGRILVRPSGTEPLLRVMAEGPNEEELHEIVEGISRIIYKNLG